MDLAAATQNGRHGRAWRALALADTICIAMVFHFSPCACLFAAQSTATIRFGLGCHRRFCVHRCLHAARGLPWVQSMVIC